MPPSTKGLKVPRAWKGRGPEGCSPYCTSEGTGTHVVQVTVMEPGSPGEAKEVGSEAWAEMGRDVQRVRGS